MVKIMSQIEISKKTIIINSLSSALSLLINLTVLVWLQQYLLKHISAEEYSLIPIVLSVMAFAPLLTSVLTGGMGRYMTIAYAKGDNMEVTRICSTMFPILFFAGSILLILGWFVAWNVDMFLVVSSEYRTDAKIMLALMVFVTAIRLPLAAFSSGFMLKQKLWWQDLIDVGCQLLRITILFVLLFEVSTRALWVTVALAISELVNLAISTPISIKLIPQQRIQWSLFRKKLAKEITAFGSWWLVGSLADVLKKTMDPLILNRFASAVDVTIFYVADIAPRLLTQILTPITRPFIPILGAMVANNDHIKLRNTYTRTARYHSWVVLTIAVPAMVFSTETMHLYLHGKYDTAGGIMTMLLGVAIINALNALGSAVALSAGDMKGLSVRVVFIQTVNLILTFVFVGYLHQGAYGSAYATLFAALFLETTIKWPFCWRVAHTPFRYWFKEVFVAAIFPAVPSAVFCVSISVIYSIDSWLKLVLVSGLSALIYVIMVMIFGLKQQDRIDLGRLAQKAPARLKPVLLALAKGN